MAKKSRFKVEVSSTAINDLDGIWLWNERRYGEKHADDYLRFLRQSIDELADLAVGGSHVPTQPSTQFLTVRRRTRGHGHVVVYELSDDTVVILNIFHTAQD